MRCSGVTVRGRTCRRPVRPGQTACAYHAQAPAEPEPFYGDGLDDDELQALAEAAGLAGVDAELAIMRVLVRKVISAGEVEAARRAVDTVARLVKIKHDLDATRTEHLTTSLDRVLDSLSAELLIADSEAPPKTTSPEQEASGELPAQGVSLDPPSTSSEV